MEGTDWGVLAAKDVGRGDTFGFTASLEQEHLMRGFRRRVMASDRVLIRETDQFRI